MGRGGAVCVERRKRARLLAEPGRDGHAKRAGVSPSIICNGQSRFKKLRYILILLML